MRVYWERICSASTLVLGHLQLSPHPLERERARERESETLSFHKLQREKFEIVKEECSDFGTDAVVEMGKAGNQQLPIVQQQSNCGGASTTFLCRRCSIGFYKLFSFKCALILIFSLAAFFSVFFWVIPHRHKQAGYDAEESIKLSATVQSYFQLQKPVSELVPYIARLEYDVHEEIGVPSFKVAVLSMRQSHLSNQTSLSNWTDVVFGFLPDPINRTVNPLTLSLLKSSLIDLSLQQANLTLTSSIFGKPSSFEILKFPGGITIMPESAAFKSQTLFTFTLNSSIYDVKENLLELKEQLKLGLHLMPNEAVYVQLTNKHGSTKDPPVKVETTVSSGRGTILPERLSQLAQVIVGSTPKENLGLKYSVFGKVKEISLSSFLNRTLYPPSISPSPSPSSSPTPTPTPTPSLSPSPSPSPSEGIYDTGPSLVPSYSPAFSPNSHHSLPPSKAIPTSAPTPPSEPPISHPDQMSPSLSPYSPSRAPDEGLVSTIHVSSSTYAYSCSGRIQCFYLNGLVAFLLLLGIHQR